MRNKKYEVAKYLVKNIVIFLIIYLAYLFRIRICIIYNIFKIPCAACGLTRAAIELFKGNLIESIKYNILLIPLIIGYIVYSITYIKGIFTQNNKLSKFISKYKIYLIIGASIMVIIVEIVNIQNPRLY